MDGMMDRIRDEMARHPDDGMVQVIGDHLTAYLQAYPDTALKAGATIQGAVRAMSSEARKQAKGKVGAQDFISGMKIVYDEFGIRWNKQTCMAVQMSLYDGAKVMPVQTEIETKAPADEFDLDALLGGGGL